MVEPAGEGQSMARLVHSAVLLVSLATAPVTRDAEAAPRPCNDPPATTKIAAESRYQAGRLHRILFGSEYRELWATEIEVEVLDLACEAGGLEPVRQVGQLQTPGLAMVGADGRSFTFRSVNKDPTRVLPEGLEDTALAVLVWDQISSTFPGASVAAAPVVVAGGVLQAQPRLVVMPDDPALGEYRQTFAGVLGTFEEYPTVGTFGTTEVISSEELFDRLTRSFEDRIDEQAFLRARLMDLLIGDFDRHVKQWRWVRVPDSSFWLPLPEDRDYAFSRYDGMSMRFWRDREPRFDVFGPKYPPLEGLTWTARDLDRRLLSGLDRSAWMQVANDLQTALTDEVLEQALHLRTHSEYLAQRGDDLLGSLRARRDSLVVEAEKFYEFLSSEVNLYGTNEPDRIVVDRSADGSIEVTIGPTLGEEECDPDFEALDPMLKRKFVPGETKDLRLYTGAGDDRVVVRGSPSKAVKLHVLGGADRNLLCSDTNGESFSFDLTTAHQPGRGIKVDRGLWIAPGEPLEKNGVPEYGQQGPALTARRDWGHTSYGEPWLGYGDDIGLFIGYGRIFERFSFRKRPYSAQHRLRGGFSFGRSRPRFDYRGFFRPENRRRFWKVRAEASGFDILNFYGFGNETEAEVDDDFYSVYNGRLWAEASLILPAGSGSRVSIGPVVRFTTTDTARSTLISVDQPYGVGDIGQAGIRGRFQFNSRSEPDEKDLKFTDDIFRWGPSTVGSGILLDFNGHYYPEIGDLDSYYALLKASLTGDFKLSQKGTFLGFRIGGQRNWGDFPYFDAAFIGSEKVRGLSAHRFAGDASVYGDLAVRQRIARLQVLIPGYLGIALQVDTGRVYLEGEDSDRWHSSLGSGLWWSPWNEETRFEIYAARSEENTRVYLLMGFRN